MTKLLSPKRHTYRWPGLACLPDHPDTRPRIIWSRHFTTGSCRKVYSWLWSVPDRENSHTICSAPPHSAEIFPSHSSTSGGNKLATVLNEDRIGSWAI